MLKCGEGDASPNDNMAWPNPTTAHTDTNKTPIDIMVVSQLQTSQKLPLETTDSAIDVDYQLNAICDISQADNTPDCNCQIYN